MINYFMKLREVYKIKNLVLIGAFISYMLLKFSIPILNFKLIACICITLMIFSYKKLVSLHINLVDKYLLIVSSLALSLIIYFLFVSYDARNLASLLTAFLFIYTCIVARINVMACTSSKVEYNVVDFKYILENKLDIANKEFVLIVEKEVDYDLLHRESVINQLYDTIKGCEPQNSFTIGLNGEWGSGKTTIIRNVLRIMKDNDLLSDYIVVNFNPWKYDDERAVLKALLNEILQQIDYDVTSFEKESIIQDTIKLIFFPKSPNLLDLVIDNLKKCDDRIELHQIVNNYLEKTGKKLLIIIDNLDRINDDIALFLIKSMDTIISFKRTISILLYDEEILNEFLKNKFGLNKSNKYMEKLVQLKIDIPEMSGDAIKEIRRKIARNLTIKGNSIVFFDDDNYKFENVRQLKNFINLIISSHVEQIMFMEDYFNLKYLKTVFPESYYTILNNARFFVTYDKKYNHDNFLIDNSKFESDAKEFFTDLFKIKEYKRHIKILCKMFPGITKYIPGVYITNELSLGESIIQERISNERFFDLYFTGDKNEFVRLNNDLINFINKFNKNDYSIDDLMDIDYTIKRCDRYELKVFLEDLDINLSKINEDKRLKLASYLYDNLWNFDTGMFFLELSPRSRACVIIAELISNVSKSEFTEFTKKVSHSYKDLKILEDIDYWIKNDNKKLESCKFSFSELLDEMCKKIFENDLNIYSNQYYFRGNIWVLYRYDATATQKYIKKHINSRNIYNFLSDVISESYGKKYGYSIRKEIMEYLIPNTDINIDELLANNNDYLDERKLLIKEVYEKYKANADPYNNGIERDEYIRL